MARGSLGELLSHFAEAAEDGLLTADEHRSLVEDTNESLRVLGGLMRYLLATETPRNGS